MDILNDADLLLDHFESHLGNIKNSFRAKKEGDFPFMVLSYSQQSNGVNNVLLTCGLSAHRLYVGSENRLTRIELGIFARGSWDNSALSSLLTSVALYLYEAHEAPGAHGILPGEGAVLNGGNPLFESFYLRSPVGFPEDLSICESNSLPIEILQLIPITSSEEKIIRAAGWKAFEEAVIVQKIDLLSFDTRLEVHEVPR